MRLTQAEVDAHNARVLHQRKPMIHPAPEACDDESELHAQILAECKRRGWLAFHGSMAHRARRTAGEPDFVCLLPAGRTLLVEAKTKTCKLSPAQQAVAAHAAKLMHTVHVVRSFAEFLAVAS